MTRQSRRPLDLAELDLPDGRYEYEFIVERSEDDPIVAPGPFAEELTGSRAFAALSGSKTAGDADRRSPGTTNSPKTGYPRITS
ncbi:hypothetical protein [Halorubrum sp. HHNYT27]|uniref:hypothetical protein n=1 Tax=Halorubrum sp. HHNYT27 TaxID=3402275 RepID=UPI003EBAD753